MGEEIVANSKVTNAAPAAAPVTPAQPTATPSQPAVVPEKSNKKMFIIIGVLVVVVIIAAVVGAFLLMSGGDEDSLDTEENSPETGGTSGDNTRALEKLTEEEKYMRFSAEVLCETVELTENLDENDLEAGMNVFGGMILIMQTKIQEYGYTPEEHMNLTEKYGGDSEFNRKGQDLAKEMCPEFKDAIEEGTTETEMENSNSSHIDECYSQEDYDRTTCYINLGEAEMDLALCDQEESEFKWYCYRGVGSAKGDTEICDMIPVDEGKNKDWCYERIAFNLEDELLCEEIEDNGAKDLCYKRIAEKE